MNGKYFHTAYKNNKDELNKEIKEAIRKSGLRQYEIAEMLGCHPTTLASRLNRTLPPEWEKAIWQALEDANDTLI